MFEEQGFPYGSSGQEVQIWEATSCKDSLPSALPVPQPNYSSSFIAISTKNNESYLCRHCTKDFMPIISYLHNNPRRKSLPLSPLLTKRLVPEDAADLDFS